MSEHHPTPWRLEGNLVVDAKGIAIADVMAKRTDQEFIIHAVNCHEELIAVSRKYQYCLTCDDEWVCRSCGARKANGCFSNCRINNAINKAEAKK